MSYVIDKYHLKALSSEVRQEIVKLLKNRSYTASELSRVLGKHVTTVSNHMEILEKAGLIEKGDADHKWIYYKLTPNGEKMFKPQSYSWVLAFCVGIIGAFFIVSSLVEKPAETSEMTSEEIEKRSELLITDTLKITTTKENTLKIKNRGATQVEDLEFIVNGKATRATSSCEGGISPEEECEYELGITDAGKYELVIMGLDRNVKIILDIANDGNQVYLPFTSTTSTTPFFFPFLPEDTTTTTMATFLGTSTTTLPLACSDSDGLDYFVEGYASGMMYDGMIRTDVTDQCGLNGNVNDIGEWHCSDDILYSEYFSCPNGCRGGICLPVIEGIDFNCDNIINNTDTEVISYYWRNGITIDANEASKATCQTLYKYLSDLWKAGVNQIGIDMVTMIGKMVQEAGIPLSATTTSTTTTSTTFSITTSTTTTTIVLSNATKSVAGACAVRSIYILDSANSFEPDAGFRYAKKHILES